MSSVLLAVFGLVVSPAATTLGETELNKTHLKGPQSAPGYIDFRAAALPPASVEVDLTHGIFGDLFGLGDAALAGAMTAFTDSSGSNEATEATRFAAKQLGELRSVLPLAKDVIREVRVRAYREQHVFSEMAAQFDSQLKTGNWQCILRVRDGKMAANVSLLRSNGTIQGVFILASERDKTILANVVCDISPEKAEKLAAAITKIGLDAGLRKELERKLKQLHE